MIFLSLVLRIMNWLSYENGLAYVQNAHGSFAGSETRGQVDLVSRYQFESSPAVVACGTLAMFHWDATPVLAESEYSRVDHRRKAGHNHTFERQ